MLLFDPVEVIVLVIPISEQLGQFRTNWVQFRNHNALVFKGSVQLRTHRIYCKGYEIRSQIRELGHRQFLAPIHQRIPFRKCTVLWNFAIVSTVKAMWRVRPQGRNTYIITINFPSFHLHATVSTAFMGHASVYFHHDGVIEFYSHEGVFANALGGKMFGKKNMMGSVN